MQRSILSPWFFFWLIIGGLFFAFQIFLYLSDISNPFSPSTEAFALSSGMLLAGLLGLGVARFFPYETRDWRFPRYLFSLWMVIPAIFPLLFLFGVFLQRQELIDFQESHYRELFELALFMSGLTLLYLFVRSKKFTQGSVSIVLISLLFIIKASTTNVFYLTGRCPRFIIDERFAWLSSNSQELRRYTHKTPAENFYFSPIGKFICTRTEERAF